MRGEKGGEKRIGENSRGEREDAGRTQNKIGGRTGRRRKKRVKGTKKTEDLEVFRSITKNRESPIVSD